MKTAQGTQVNTTCLVDPDPSRTTISLQMCGNGIVEAGEDCDPGIGSQSNCCDVSTCKFKNNAVCDPESSSCCTAQCSFAPATQVCRPALDQQCDTAEYCTGNSSSCPANIVAKNGAWISSWLGFLQWNGFSDVLCFLFIIKGNPVGAMVWHVPVVSARLSPVSLFLFCARLKIL